MKCPLCNDLNLEISVLVSHLLAQTLQTLDFGFVKKPSRLCVLQWAEASKVVGADGGARTRKPEAADFKSALYANSITSAYDGYLMKITQKVVP